MHIANHDVNVCVYDTVDSKNNNQLHPIRDEYVYVLFKKNSHFCVDLLMNHWVFFLCTTSPMPPLFKTWITLSRGLKNTK